MIKVVQFDETSLKILTNDYGIEQEISEYFSFEVPGYRFTPAYKSGRWDGYLRLFDMRKKTLAKGLLPILLQFFEEREHEFSITGIDQLTSITLEESIAFMDSLNLHARGVKLEIRDYQYDAVYQSLKNKRLICLAPTSSGKSAILYTALRYHIAQERKIILVVPSTQLVEQMWSDFEDYSSVNEWSVEDNCQTLYSGKEKIFSKNVMISTWHSLHSMKKNSPKLFNDIVNQTDVLLCDEAHSYKGAQVIETMNSFVHTEFRTGTTGTLDDSKINQLVLIGLMGTPYQVTTTKRLMDDGQVTQLLIKAFLLEHPIEVRKAMKGMSYPDEIKFLITCAARNRFIAQLAKACTGNTLVLFKFTDTHGKILYDLIKSIVPETRYVRYVTGDVDVDVREQIRKEIDSETDGIILATETIFGQGTNIPSIENIIFAIPGKSTIRIRQLIGRGLRLKNGKLMCKLFDISDNLSLKSYKNFTLKHLEERIKIYDQEQFEYSFKTITL